MNWYKNDGWFNTGLEGKSMRPVHRQVLSFNSCTNVRAGLQNILSFLMRKQPGEDTVEQPFRLAACCIKTINEKGMAAWAAIPK